MSFNPFTGKPYQAAEEEKSDRLRELMFAIAKTKHGKEMINIFRDRLAKNDVYGPGVPEEVARHTAGRQSVYRDWIKIADAKPKTKKKKE